MIATPPRASADVLRFEEQMGLVEGVIDDFVRFRDSIVGNPRGEPGTAGVLVLDSAANKPGLLTAGHIFPGGAGEKVDIIKRGLLFFETREPLGQVTHHEIPLPNQAGWDAAIVELLEGVQPSGRLVGQGVNGLVSPEPVVVHGSITGFVLEAAVQGALNEIAYGESGRRWKCCWIMAPSGVLKSGDSGAAVFTRRDSCLLGMFVGSSYLKRSNKALFHYVQDAFSLEADLLKRWRITLFR
jgi:hypothetical protein